MLFVFLNLLGDDMLYENYTVTRHGEPSLYYCGQDEDLPSGARYGPVIRNAYIVECCTGGYGSVIINGTEFPVRAGDCYVLLPQDTVIHTAAEACPRQGVWCVIDGPQVERAVTRAGITAARPFAPAGAFAAITAEIQVMLDMRKETDPGADLRRVACIYALLGAMLRATPVTAADKNIWIHKALGVIEAQYDRPLTVGRLAAEVGLERSYFTTLFKEQMGVTPHAYITTLRIQKACALMHEGSAPVGEVAASVGLDPKNFARLFKKETGKTPREYLMP